MLMENADLKFCKDCKHWNHNPRVVYDMGCTPLAVCLRDYTIQNDGIDLVSGETTWRFTGKVHFCKDERYDGLCGKKGKFWEAKDNG